MNLLDLAQKYVILKKVSASKGGEWQGACPRCGEEGHDPSTGAPNRFHVWPADNNGTGRGWCRRCGWAGDSIQFLIDFEGLTFKDACARLDIGLGSLRRQPPVRPQRFEPTVYETPTDLWIERATKFLTWSQECLEANPDALAWLAERGIGASLAAWAGLGWNPGEKGRDTYRSRESWGLPTVMTLKDKPKKLWIPRGLVIPLIIDDVVIRLRIRRWEDEGPRYYMVPGSSPAMMILGAERPAFVVVESELDAILCSLHPCAGSATMGTASAHPDARAYRILQDSRGVLVGMDFDKAGADAFGWWSEQFRHAKRWPVPVKKDPGEAFKAGVDIYDWIDRGLTPAARMWKPVAGGQGSGIRDQGSGVSKARGHDPISSHQIGIVSPETPALHELYDLLRRNPVVTIFNTPDRLTVLRNRKYVGGRINELVFRVPEVLEYITNHPAVEITGENLIT
ncbi:hypothetical protein ES708_01006 [subsurface metagenome]